MKNTSITGAAKIRNLVAAALLFGVSAITSISAAATDECENRVNSDARLAPIREQLPKVITEPTLQQLSDHSKPTKIQKKALIAYDEVRSFCERQFGAQYTGQAANIFSAFAAKSKTLRASLYSGNIDFATFVVSDQENMHLLLNELDATRVREERLSQEENERKEREAIAERQRQELIEAQEEALERQKQQYEAARKRQELQDLSNSLKELGDSFRRNTPVVTNCYSYGRNTNCTTY
jgi:hypothetical protein